MCSLVHVLTLAPPPADGHWGVSIAGVLQTKLLWMLFVTNSQRLAKRCTSRLLPQSCIGMFWGQFSFPLRSRKSRRINSKLSIVIFCTLPHCSLRHWHRCPREKGPAIVSPPFTTVSVTLARLVNAKQPTASSLRCEATKTMADDLQSSPTLTLAEDSHCNFGELMVVPL